MSRPMVLLTDTAVRQALPMAVAIETQATAFSLLALGKVQMPLRNHLPVLSREAVSLTMPVYAKGETEEALAVKVVSVFPKNAAQGIPTIHGLMLVFDPQTGQPTGILDGRTFTAIRTGAASGLATDLLARRDSQVVAIFGAGAQARTQLEAVCTIRTITKVWVYAPHQDSGERFIQEMAGQGMVPTNVHLARIPQEAIAEADIICAATTSAEPVFADQALPPGVHVNAVGSHLPTHQEIPDATVARALTVVDSRTAALAEAGDILQSMKAGLISAEHIHAELGEIILGMKKGRSTPEQITLFKSVGVAVQDAFAAQVALQRALEHGLGQMIDWEEQES